MRVSATTDHALRAIAELAAAGHGGAVDGERLAPAGVPDGAWVPH